MRGSTLFSAQGGLMIDRDQQWKLIIKIHNLTKTLVLKCEEIDPDHEFYFPIIIQQRDALDHLVRAAFGMYFPEKLLAEKKSIIDPEKYSNHQTSKALGHMYRAFFDAADWTSILCRERISDMMSVYSMKTIHFTFPSYVSRIKPKIEEISLEIANVRNSKDIGQTGEVIDGIDNYMSLISELINFMDEIQNKISDLNKAEFEKA